MHIPIFKDGSDDKPVRIAHDYNGLTLNDPTDDPDDTFLIEQTSEQVFYDSVVEPNAETDGSHASEVRRVQSLHRIDGWVKAPSLAKLHDKIAALNEAFDPVLAYENTSHYDRGYLPYDFDVPTLDTDNYATGLIAARYYLQAIQLPVAVHTKFDGFQARFNLMMRAIDPRAYLQTTESANRTGNGDITLNNTLATYPSWPIIEIEFTTAEADPDMTITRTTDTDLAIELEAGELSDSAGETLIIDPYKKSYKYESGGNKIAAIKVGTRFFQVLPQSNTVTIASAPSDSVTTITWRRAFV